MIILGSTLFFVAEAYKFFLIIPIVLVITAIPIAPMGIGVGQLAIYQLLTIVGVKNPAEGATLMTLYQSITICINFLGLFPYLKQGRKNEQPKFNIN